MRSIHVVLCIRSLLLVFHCANIGVTAFIDIRCLEYSLTSLMSVGSVVISPFLFPMLTIFVFFPVIVLCFVLVENIVLLGICQF